ncbi:hypothetical protein BST95_17425 [Halioglobus japonicus]|uniref:hypothetical protein n=1 Tax=Halioglobus japonicus TaxID=930805 RepID=UPI0009797F53|nr:hypothetical protein [Halioglobus japonicus]AQA19760.1 hypothetical protein BST95_17425 [Halioglobus japonicus]GHD09871.1 hypothetical protein GCM10007052_08470 [Halioglobus japonicus]
MKMIAANSRVILGLSFLLLCLFTLWIYWPGQSGPALLDDRVVLGPLSELEQSPSLAWDFVFRDTSGLLGRSVSMATFVAEKVLLGDDIAISKTLNIVLHIANGGLLFWLLTLIFSGVGERRATSLALVLTAIWLLSPLFVSSVLYAVQRMAMLSSTFMLAACICYALWRRRLAAGEYRGGYLVALGLCVALGLLAKENTIVVVPVILLLEAFWYQFRDEQGRLMPRLRLVVWGLIVVGGVGLLVALAVLYQDLAAAFARRAYTMEERVITQLSILWDYVGQLIWPDVLRMGIYHDDYPVSHSLAEPTARSALIAWLAVLACVAVASRWPWGRRFALGPLWFLAGHSIEASVFSLELYFEHRNYFPAIGLLISLGVLLSVLLRRWPQLHKPLLAWSGVICLWLALLTASQVQLWSSRPLLTFAHYNGHPRSYRATSDMALLMASAGDMALARQYSLEAFKAAPHERSSDLAIRNLTLYCIVDQAAPGEMIAQLGLEHPQRPFRSPASLLYLARLVQEGECPTFNAIALADRMWQIFGMENAVATAHYSLFYGLATLENTLQRYEHALFYNQRYLRLRPGNVDGLLMQLHFGTALQDAEHRQAALDALLRMQADGTLSVAQRQTLALYMEK